MPETIENNFGDDLQNLRQRWTDEDPDFGIEKIRNGYMEEITRIEEEARKSLIDQGFNVNWTILPHEKARWIHLTKKADRFEIHIWLNPNKERALVKSKFGEKDENLPVNEFDESIWQECEQLQEIYELYDQIKLRHDINTYPEKF